ncbi:MAG: NADP-reducing hydrogenase subunit HndB, partial [Clostridiales bacterium]|nr:NADP-reducing hydrogenase subunit HndB [Clostridiales bacterium]
MPIKSLDELKAIRESQMKKVKLRDHGESDDLQIEILIGMATCGIAAGSREVLNAFIDIIDSENLDHIKVVPVGCMGYCHSEPTVQVNIPGQEPILYGNIHPEDIANIIHKHIE